MSVATSISYIDISNNEPDSVQARVNAKSITIPASVAEITDSSFENSIVESIIFTDDSQLKTIGKAAFKNCKFFKSIQIPPSVVEIADEAFFDSSLEEIVFTYDSQLKTIGKGAFRDCKLLKSITISDSVTHLESNSFRNSAIEKVLFGENSQCTTIGQNAFRDCHFLKSIEIPSSVLKIADGAFFHSCIQTLIFIDDSRLETIGKFAFDKCQSLESIKIPSSVVKIEEAAFVRSNIQTIIFEDASRLETIGKNAFNDCRFLQSIEIPSSVLKIEDAAFADSNIQTIIFEDASRLETIGEFAFDNCRSLESIKIPSSVVTIDYAAFSGSTIKEVIFPNDSKLEILSEYIFGKCPSLKSITIPASILEIGGFAFYESGIEEVVYSDNSNLKTIGERAFANCQFLKSITIPESVTHIESNSFRNAAIEDIFFGANSQCTTIGDYAFNDCRFLKSIEIPSSVLKIKDAAFFHSCIQTIVFTDDSRLETIDESAFRECKSLQSIKIPSSVLTIGNSAFSGSSIQTIVFTNDSRLETIGEFAFDKCKSLESIKIPFSVVAIGYSAFSESAIKQVIFSDDSKLETLNEYIFEKCVSLKSITLPASILEIGESAFSGSGIEEVLFSQNSNLKTIGKDAFRQSRLSKPIQIPMSVVEIGEAAFKRCYFTEITFAENSRLETIHLGAFNLCKFQSIKIPDSVVMIAERAFSECTKLEDVLFSVNSQLETIGEETFFGCTSLKSFTFPQSLREIGNYAFSLCSLPKSITLSSPSVEFLGDPFTKSGVDQIIFGNGEKTQTTEKNNHFLQLCKEGDFSKCVEYLEHNDVNLLYVRSDSRYSGGFTDDTITEDAMSIGMTTKNVDLITFLIKNKVLMYSNCQNWDIKKCFTDDIFENVFFKSATVFWYSICSFVKRKMYKFIRRLLNLLRSKEYVEEWVSIFKNFHQNTPLQGVTQGDSLDLYHFLIDYELVKLVNLQVDIIEVYFRLASKFGNVAILKKSLEILPIENVSFKFTDFLMHAPQDKLYSLIKYTLPYILKNKDPFGLVVEGEYEDGEHVKYPETVLSYLAYAQAFDAFKYVIENVPNTQYTPSHLVACSLFRGYSDAKRKGNVDISNFMKLFDYILQDDIRPHVLGADMEWVGTSIFTCIEYGSSEMCLKLFSYGFDKDDIYIDVISGDKYNSYIRYSLLSYACKYQSLEVVQFLIDFGVNVDGLFPNHTPNHTPNHNHTNCRSDSNKDDQNCIDIAMEDEDEIECDVDEDKHTSDDDNNDDDVYGDVTNPEEYIFMDADIKNAWFEPYFNPYRLNKNQDVEIYCFNSTPFDPSTEDPLERFLERTPTGYLTLFNVTPLGAAVYAQNLDLVRLLLKDGANPNANTFSGFPHLFVLGAGDVIDLCENYDVRSPEVEYPVIEASNDMEGKKEEGQMEEQEKGKKMKMENKSGDEDVSASIPAPDKKSAIFQELVNYGADLFHEQTVCYVTDDIDSRELNIYDLCTHLNYSLDLLKYLQTIPQLCDKIKKHYIDSFLPTIIGYSDTCPLFSVDTVDYMFQNGYLNVETYKEDDKFKQAVSSRFHAGMKPVLEKYGFHFANLATSNE